MDKMSFDKVYADHKETVWKLVSRYASSKHDREDLFQEVFLQIHRSLSSFRGDSSIETWIYRVTVNTAINQLKKQQRHKKIKETLSWLRVVEVEKEENEEEGEIMKPLAKLNPQQRAVLIMAEVEERKLEEISQVLNIPVGTVKSNLHRAKEIVRKELRDNG
ncbi:MAG: RNA polymerase sigma factor [Candidatus Margulisiibacteriota bacterium]